MGKRKNRTLLFKRVFEELFHESDETLFYEDILDEMDEESIASINADFNELISKKQELMDIVAQYSGEFDISRVYKIDLAILLVATFELNYRPDTPDKVVINEAVELAKKYSTDKSYAYINGVLAKIISK